MKRLALISACLLCLQAFAQQETAVWSYLSLTKTLTERWTVGAQTELRTGDDNKRMYMWYLDFSATYKLNNHLRLGAGYDYIGIHTRATATHGSKWRPVHRPYVQIIPSVQFGNVRFQLNDWVTYHWFPETKGDGFTLKGKAYFLFRHRLSTEYIIKGSRFKPYNRTEIRHNPTMERFRTVTGTTIRLSNRFSLDCAYVYQAMHKSTKTHALSIGYQIRL